MFKLTADFGTHSHTLSHIRTEEESTKQSWLRHAQHTKLPENFHALLG